MNKVGLIVGFISILIPASSFCWGESKHSIDEVLIQRMYLDTNYVFCGCRAYWGTNKYGLFVFDRRTEEWKNYRGFGLQVEKIIKSGNNVIIKFSDPGIRYVKSNLVDGSWIGCKKPIEEKKLFQWEIETNGIKYGVSADSITIMEDEYETVYRPNPEQIPPPRGIESFVQIQPNLFLIHPISLGTKIYSAFAVNHEMHTIAKGVTAFDINNKSFEFFLSDLVVGCTGSFVGDSCIIFPTAFFGYEINAQPAVGFVSFDPKNLTFSKWNGANLPEEPLALFCVEQDEREYWIGTDKGVFRTNKATGRCIHYNIVGGTVVKDSTPVHAGCGNFGENYTPIAYFLNKGDEVELIGELNEWCEIKSLVQVTGWVVEKCIKKKIFQDGVLSHVKLGMEYWATIWSEPNRKSLPPLAILEIKKGKEPKYKVIKKFVKTFENGQEEHWYALRLSTAWVNLNKLLYKFGEVE
ncbi:hypothetical protein KAX02_01985 [candidate division WOR-3 bacterium]|nr:hypothetical protein [candidate division WOR-3 bacterium]